MSNLLVLLILFDETKIGFVINMLLTAAIMNPSSLTLETIIKLLKVFKEHHQAEYQLKSLGIFGSYACHQANAESDIDIFFETDAPNLFKTAHLREELETLLGLSVDLVRLRDNMNPQLKSRIENNALYV